VDKIYPKGSSNKIALFKKVASSIQSEYKSFNISKIMSIIISKYKLSRRDLLKDIQAWIKEDPLVILERTDKNIKYYRI